MSKLDNKYNNPVDILLEKLYEPFIEPLHKVGVTPNMLTTTSMLCGLYSAKLILDKRPKEAALFFALNYIFDCMDGHMARRFDMETNFGDWYDHITDWLTFGFIGYALFKTNKYNRKTIIILSLIFMLLTLNMTIWIGCQEKVYNKDVGKSISFYKKVCNDPETDLLRTKLLGVGTMNVFTILVIYFSQK